MEDQGVALPEQGAGLGGFERVVQSDELRVGELVAVSIERPLDGLDRVGLDGEGDELGDERGELVGELGGVELEDHQFDEGVDALGVSQFELVDAVGAGDVGELSVFAQRRECSGHQVDVVFGVGDELDIGEAFGFHDGELQWVAGRVGVRACALDVDCVLVGDVGVVELGAKVWFAHRVFELFDQDRGFILMADLDEQGPVVGVFGEESDLFVGCQIRIAVMHLQEDGPSFVLDGDGLKIVVETRCGVPFGDGC